MISEKTSTAQKHLDLYEPWAEDHQEAMKCRDLEEWLNEGVAVFNMLAFEEAGTRSAYRAKFISHEEGVAFFANIRERYGRWLKIAASGRDAISWCRERFGDVRHAAEFEACVVAAESAVARPMPAVAKAAGALHDELSGDEADELRGMFARPEPVPAREYKVLQLGDPSRLR